MTSRLAIVLLAVLACACSTTQSRTGPGHGWEPPPDQGTASLFPGDAEVLSDSRIGEILRASPGLPVPAAVAIVHIQHESAARFWGYGRYWWALRPGTRQQLADALIEALWSTNAVSRAAPLPTFLLPEEPSVAHLREASARFRTDAVLVFRSDCQAYERHRFFRASEAKAFCSVEAALLDTRTGIVPFTSTSMKDFAVEKSKSDANMLETVRRAETEALEAALTEVGRTIGSSLARGPS